MKSLLVNAIRTPDIPTLINPDNVKVTEINTANEMLKACMNSLPADISIFAAAVSDWKVANQSSKKIKKSKTFMAICC